MERKALLRGYEELLKAYLVYDAVVFLSGTALNFVDHRMKNVIDRITGPEYMSEKQIQMYNLVGRYVSRFYIGHIAKKLGCREKLDARLYEKQREFGISAVKGF